MNNKAMERHLKAGDAIDVAGYAKTPEGYYVLNTGKGGLDKEDIEGKDLCDAKTEQWIWSVGKELSTGRILAATSAVFYQNPQFECLWLR